MITTHGITVRFGGPPLFEDVSVKFLPGYCYGLTGANGAGKSTFLKVLSGELEPSAGSVEIPNHLRLSTLEQDQFKHDEDTVLDTVFQGHPRLYEVLKQREALYAKPDFSEEDGNLAGELEAEFADLGGYECEAQAGTLLAGLGVDGDLLDQRMGDLEAGIKVRVLLAQAMFGSPDILLLDEPTNHLDVHTVAWLESYIANLDALVIVVSHDRHFLNNVCTHIADIDFRQVKVYAGNYDFWLQASELALQQRRDASKKAADKAKELEAFIARFSSNASKARQATSRKKLLEKLTIDQLPTSTRKYPHIKFEAERPCGRSVLEIEDLTYTLTDEGGVHERLIDGFSMTVHRGDKIAFVGPDDRARNALFRILAGELESDSGRVEWGATITPAYYPRENEAFFDREDRGELNLIDWLRQFSADQHEQTMRGFLGRMLFSGDDTLKRASVLSGGERVRCMLARTMLVGANALILEEPTNHLDLESITALNTAMSEFEGVLLFSSHDRELVNTVATRIVELTPHGAIDHLMTLDEYIGSERVMQQRRELYGGEALLAL